MTTTTVTRIGHLCLMVQAIGDVKKGELIDFLLPSGDGYSLAEITDELNLIKDFTGSSPTLYSGMDYKDIPFKAIYEIYQEDNYRDYFREPPKLEECNSYDHGFLHVMSFYNHDELPEMKPEYDVATMETAQ